MKASVLNCLNSAFIEFTPIITATVGQAANYSTDANLETLVTLTEQGRYDSAIILLRDMLDVDPDNADIMSMLDFSSRNTRNYLKMRRLSMRGRCASNPITAARTSTWASCISKPSRSTWRPGSCRYSTLSAVTTARKTPR